MLFIVIDNSLLQARHITYCTYEAASLQACRTPRPPTLLEPLGASQSDTSHIRKAADDSIEKGGDMSMTFESYARARPIYF